MSLVREPRKGQNKFNVAEFHEENPNHNENDLNGGITNRNYEGDEESGQNERNAAKLKNASNGSGRKRSFGTVAYNKNSAIISSSFQAPTSANVPRKTFWESFSLLLWKNFKLRTRHWFITLLELILPTIFTLCIVYMKSLTPQVPPVQADLDYRSTELTDRNLIKQIKDWHKAKNVGTQAILAYAPQNDLVDQIMASFNESIFQIGKKYRQPLKHVQKGFDSEEEIQEFNAKQGLYRRENETKQILRAAIIFQEGFSNGSPGSSQYEYKIRMVDRDYKTGEIYEDPDKKQPGPNTKNAAKGYQEGGFASLQIYLDKAITKALTNHSMEYTVSLQGFPYPPYKTELGFSKIFLLLLPWFTVFGFVFIVPSILRRTVAEKESGIKELMKIMSLESYMHWIGWFVDSIAVLILPVTIVVVLLFTRIKEDTEAFIEYSDPSLWWVAIFLYILAAVSFLFFMSTLFQKATMAISVGTVFWIISYLALAIVMDRRYLRLSLAQKMSACLLPNMGFHWAITLMYSFETKGLGAKWSNVNQPLTSLDDFTVLHVLIMLLIDTVIYMCLTLYLENVFPSKYGVSKPWNYIFKPSFWRKNAGVDSSEEMLQPDAKTALPKGFETEPVHTRPKVQIVNLKKAFGPKKKRKVAVHDLSLNLYQGQITVLLGCNGAGKSTTISMLTGLFGPSAGTARINGLDIRKDMDTIRTQLGYCPQDNILFPNLTVRENLYFFGRLKGMPEEEVKEDIKYLVKKLGLAEKSSSLAGSLSGGQKRKLCLGMSLVGGSQFVIMDEPTAGMDPEARRGIWDLLLEVRRKRTMLLTTHFMEEADILGDRIAIMASGRLHCSGSPLFLKRYYGSGSTLKMSVYAPPKSNCDKIFELVRKYAPEAFWKDTISELNQNDVCDISIVLPRVNGINDTSKFPDMFAELSEKKHELGIIDIGLPLTTMDDVFAKVDEETRKVQEKDSTKDTKLSNLDFGSQSNDVKKLAGMDLQVQHFKGLFKKRLIYTQRKKVLFSVQLLLPFLLVIGIVNIFNWVNAPNQPSPPLRIDMNPYKFPKMVYRAEEGMEDLGGIYEKLIQDQPAAIGAQVFQANASMSLEEYLLLKGREDETEYRERYVAAADFKPNAIKAMFQTLPNHASPLSINLVSNAFLRFLSKSADITLSVINHPMKSGLSSLLDSCTQNPRGETSIPLLFVLILPIGLATLAASFIVFPLEERLCRAKHLQMMTGVNIFTFWASSFVWDLFMVIFLAIAIVISFPFFEQFSAFTTGTAAPTFFLIIVIFGISSISFSYIFSLGMKSVHSGFALLVIIHILTGIILGLGVHFMEQSNFFFAADVSRWIGRVISPTFGAAISFIRFAYKVHKNVRCNMLTDEVKGIVCNPNITDFDSTTTSDPVKIALFRACCDNCETDLREQHSVQCFQQTEFLIWDGPIESEHVSSTEILPGIGQELFYMLVMALIYQLILFALEYMKTNPIQIFTRGKFPEVKCDEDVVEERKRVDELSRSAQTDKDAIVVSHLRKRFGKFAAVSDVSYGVHKGECFGLLGVNGAGKTTLFQMMTGNLTPTSGNVFIDDVSLNESGRAYTTQIGYCPQYDGLIDCLTGKETVELFARLRGYPETEVQNQALKWLSLLGLENSADVQCMKYSGGMKRRLSAAVAMVGQPKVIMLDEPTSGVDPISRRQFWALVSAGKESGQALILTSHSMDECEALCSRLGIMVDGGMRCLGTTQHLKGKYSQGYSIMLKFNQQLEPAERERAVAPILAEVTANITPCELKEQHENVVEYQIRNPNLDLSVIFKLLEGLKQQHSDILEDYSVNETTLEEIFLSIAKAKRSSRKLL